MLMSRGTKCLVNMQAACFFPRVCSPAGHAVDARTVQGSFCREARTDSFYRLVTCENSTVLEAGTRCKGLQHVEVLLCCYFRRFALPTPIF